jgi:signal transduction histidine kinase
MAPLSKPAKNTDDRARLEAFLAAFPGEYCGWGKDRSVAYSSGFCDILGLETVRTLADIQNRLSPSDSAALEGLFERLRENSTPFVTISRNHDSSKIYKISGSQGTDLSGRDKYTVLWVEDITENEHATAAFNRKKHDRDKRLKRLEQAFEAIPSPRWLRDELGTLLWVNRAYSDAVGHTEKDILEQQKELPAKIRQPKTAKDKPVLGPELAALAVRTKQTQSEKAHINIGGKRLLMQIKEVPLTEVGLTLGLAEDITAEEELQTELIRYQSSNKELMEQLRSAIAIFSSEQTLEFYNSAFAQLWGLEGGWLNTKPKLGDIMEKLRETRRLPEQADFRRFKQSWLDMFTSLIDPFEDMLYLPDGSALRMLVIPHSMGGLMMTFEDVTSRLELESSYNTLIAVQKETLDNLGEAVSVYGGDGRLKLWNPAFGRLWNFNPEDLDGQPHISSLVQKLSPFFAKDEWAERQEELISKALDRMMHDGRLKRSDNTLVDYTTVPLPDGGVLITYTDVTDTVRVENALREKNAALEAAEQLKLDFLANVSYQLRTPLNAIMGFNEILDQEFFGPLNDKQKEYTRDTHKASERLLELINDILDLATLEAGYMTLQREDISIYNMMENITELVNDWARKKDIEVHMTCAKNIGKISADEKRLKQALFNVIRNAINFTPDGGEINMTVKKLKEGLEINVQDTGVGIQEKDRMRIFEPFERAQSGSLEAGLSRSGAGLGLSLVKNIMALHGGTVDLTSKPGSGTTVRLFIPFISVQTNIKLPIKQKASV